MSGDDDEREGEDGGELALDLSPLGEEALACLPVFPLPRVVFFPGTILPLHLFENRYRHLVEDCVARGPRAMAVALLRPGWERDYEGRPPIHEIAGAGHIVAHERRPDGTWDIALSGCCRVRLDELPAEGLSYRRARATVLPDEQGSEHVAANDLRALLSCASSVAAAVRRKHPDFTLGTRDADPPGRVADLIADRLVGDTARRQQVLETLEVPARVRLVTDHAGELLALLATHDVPS